ERGLPPGVLPLSVLGLRSLVAGVMSLLLLRKWLETLVLARTRDRSRARVTAGRGDVQPRHPSHPVREGNNRNEGVVASGHPRSRALSVAEPLPGIRRSATCPPKVDRLEQPNTVAPCHFQTRLSGESRRVNHLVGGLRAGFPDRRGE